MKHAICIAVILSTVFLTIYSASDGKGGFIFTAPKKLLSGIDERVCISFRNISEVARVQVVVQEQKGSREIASARENITSSDNGSKCFNISIPRSKSKTGRLLLSVSYPAIEDYSINYEEQIFIQSSSDIVFILTDKPVYNGGHTVRFRIFIIRSDLTLVDENVDRIWIENPNGVHLAQWVNESTENKFIDKFFRLSNEPLTGLWNIKVKRKFDDVVSQGFMVENYVLPRFTVNIDSPKSVNSSSDFNVTACAKYLFGAPVHGVAHFHMHVKCSFSFYCYANRTSLTAKLKLNADGCVTHKFRLNNISSFAQKVAVNVTVRETGTEAVASSAAGIIIKTVGGGSGLEFSSSTKEKRLKLGLPFKGQITHKNRSLTVDSDVMLCLDLNNRKQCRHLRLENGIADFVLTPDKIENEKNFTASLEMNFIDKYSESGQHNVKLMLAPWYSPSGSYIELENLSNGPLKCDRIGTFNVMYSTSLSEIPQFHYQVKSKGIIVKDGTINSEPSPIVLESENVIGDGSLDRVKQFQFSLNITSNFSPGGHLLIYFIMESGEVVADSLFFNVAKCLRTPVSLKWSKNSSLPGDMNSLEIETTPNAVCSLSVTDRATKYLSKSFELNKDYVFKSLKKFDIEMDVADPSPSLCRNVTYVTAAEDAGSFLSMPETDSRFIDSTQAFQDFGVLVITDLRLQTRPCKDEWKTEKSMKNVTGRQSSVRSYGNEVGNIMQPRSDFIKVITKQQEILTGFERRIFFPETWVWDLIDVSSSGKRVIELLVPHTITEWDTEAICLSKENGLGIADIKRLTSYQSFFLDFVVPHSVRRKEVFHLSVSVFNYEQEDLPIKITYSPSNKFVSKSENFFSYCISSKSKVVHEFILEPSIIGQALVTVAAEIDSQFDGYCGNFSGYLRDVVSKKLFVKHEGFPVVDVKSGFICANNKNFENEISWPIKIPADIVERSVSLNAFVSGDILGPSLKNLDKLITLPTGCGEQNMIMLAPNILILEYLLLTKPGESQIIEKALKNVDLGYQKQLNFRRDDGSYSAFGQNDESGSIWLTAFVVRYLSQAQKFIHIDKNDLDISVRSILRHQLENGCFPIVGQIYHRDLKGKFFENDSSKALTAYILISLIEPGLLSAADSSMKNAVYCLKGTEKSSGTYGDLLTTYALLMVGEVRDAQALMFELLKSASRSYGLLWWENDQESSPESSVEMTAYGILCLLKLGGSHFTAAASDAVKWIMQYRNRNGGFVSSQDTIIALEAISKLSASLPRVSDLEKLVIDLESTDNKYSFDVAKDNFLLQQEQELPTYLTNVKFSASGQGCALVQTQIKYNVRHGTHSNHLKIQLKIDSISDVDLYFVTKFNICARHKSPTDSVKMAVLEVFMVSGFYPDRASLYDIPISRKGVRKWEEYEERVVFYFEDLRQRKVCVQFLVNQEACIEKTSPALIKLYDYYNSKHITSVKYSLQPECGKSSGNWLNTTEEDKSETKRDVKESDYILGFNNSNLSHFEVLDFVNVGYDLETPDEIGPLPVYVPQPSNGTVAFCPSCLDEVPRIFSNLYCSAQAVFSVNILGKGFLRVTLDLTPRADPKYQQKIVSFTVTRGCRCPILNEAGASALIVVVPSKSNEVDRLQSLHLDNSAVVIRVQQFDEQPDYLKKAIEYCRQWSQKTK